MELCRVCDKEAFVSFKTEDNESNVTLCHECWATTTAETIKMVLEFDNCTKNEKQSQLIVASFLILLNFFTDSIVEAKNASKS